jgi:hypothetical protein
MKYALLTYIGVVVGYALLSILGYYYLKYVAYRSMKVIRKTQEWVWRITLVIFMGIVGFLGYQLIERTAYYPLERMLTYLIVIVGYIVVLLLFIRFGLSGKIYD